MLKGGSCTKPDVGKIPCRNQRWGSLTSSTPRCPVSFFQLAQCWASRKKGGRLGNRGEKERRKGPAVLQVPCLKSKTKMKPPCLSFIFSDPGKRKRERQVFLPQNMGAKPGPPASTKPARQVSRDTYGSAKQMCPECPSMPKPPRGGQ